MTRKRRTLPRRVGTLALLVSSLHGRVSCRGAEELTASSSSSSPLANKPTTTTTAPTTSTTSATTAAGEKSDAPSSAVDHTKNDSSRASVTTPSPHNSSSTSREGFHNSGESSPSAIPSSTRVTPHKAEDVVRGPAKGRRKSEEKDSDEDGSDTDGERDSRGLPAASAGMDPGASFGVGEDPWALYDVIAGVDAVTSWEVLQKVRATNVGTAQQQPYSSTFVILAAAPGMCTDSPDDKLHGQYSPTIYFV